MTNLVITKTFKWWELSVCFYKFVKDFAIYQSQVVIWFQNMFQVV